MGTTVIEKGREGGGGGAPAALVEGVGTKKLVKGRVDPFLFIFSSNFLLYFSQSAMTSMTFNVNVTVGIKN